MAPDITEDMYETKCDDTDWEGFLTALTTVDSKYQRQAVPN